MPLMTKSGRAMLKKIQMENKKRGGLSRRQVERLISMVERDMAAAKSWPPSGGHGAAEKAVWIVDNEELLAALKKML